MVSYLFFFFSSRRRHTRSKRDWSSDVCSSDLADLGLYAVRAINIDVTERIQAEISLKEASRRKDEFLAMLAHELRNPLAPIRSEERRVGKECRSQGARWQ